MREPPVSFDAPPPPPIGWTLEDGPARAALLPPPSRTSSPPAGFTLPQNRGGCGCGVAVVALVIAITAGIGGVVAAFAGSVNEDRGVERRSGPALALGSEVRFSIGEDDIGVHPLDLGEGAVTVTVTSLDDDFDPVLRILDGSGTVLGENDDADGLDSRLSFTLASAASYQAEVSEFSGDAGEYEIAVRSGATPPELDPLDATAGERIAAEELVVDDAVQRFLGAGDVAVHPLVGFEGRVTITVAGIDDFDPVVRVVDEDGGVVAENDDFDGRNSLVTFVLSPADRFDVEVREFSGDPGFYSVLLQRGDGENGAPPVLGEELERGQPVEGEVGREQEARHDYTGVGEEIVVTVEGLLGFDPVVRVVTATGAELAENDDADGLNPRVELVVADEQTVTVTVTGYGGRPGRYRVLVT